MVPNSATFCAGIAVVVNFKKLTDDLSLSIPRRNPVDSTSNRPSKLSHGIFEQLGRQLHRADLSAGLAGLLCKSASLASGPAAHGHFRRSLPSPDFGRTTRTLALARPQPRLEPRPQWHLALPRPNAPHSPRRGTCPTTWRAPISFATFCNVLSHVRQPSISSSRKSNLQIVAVDHQAPPLPGWFPRPSSLRTPSTVLPVSRSGSLSCNIGSLRVGS